MCCFFRWSEARAEQKVLAISGGTGLEGLMKCERERGSNGPETLTGTGSRGCEHLGLFARKAAIVPANEAKKFHMRKV